MGTDQTNETSDTRHTYLELAATAGRLTRATEQRYARLMYDKGLDRKVIIDRLDITDDILDRMLAVDGRRMDPDCAQHKHRACIGTTWSDADSAFIRCDCECHDPRSGDVQSAVEAEAH